MPPERRSRVRFFGSSWPEVHTIGDRVAETITSIASLLWPLLVLVGLLLFRRPLLRVVRSAEQREWTLEVGGQKLSMKQLSDQQNSMIADLQAQISVLHAEIAKLSTTRPEEATEQELAEPDLGWDRLPAPSEEASAIPNSVLWVDDVPENNALIVEQLQRNGVRVDLALSTREGLAKLGQRRYGAVLSDMGRSEEGAYVSDAGMRLLRTVRESDPTLPFLIYCSSQGALTYREAALSEGANVITASPAALSDQLRSVGLL